jgi:N-methylhydantoinase A
VPIDGEGRDLKRAFKGKRTVHFDEVGGVESAVYERDRIPIGVPIEGPAIIEEPACTTVVCPDQVVEVDRFGNLVITEVGR